MPEEDTVYVHVPKGFVRNNTHGNANVLELKRCMYGLRNSPRQFWRFLVEKLEVCGMKQSKLDPCLFVGDKVVSVMYVDDLLMWSTDDQHMIDLGEELDKVSVDLEEEDDVAGFLGVKLTKAPGRSMVMTHEGLADRIIESMGLDKEKLNFKAYSMSEGSSHQDLGW